MARRAEQERKGDSNEDEDEDEDEDDLSMVCSCSDTDAGCAAMVTREARRCRRRREERSISRSSDWKLSLASRAFGDCITHLIHSTQ